MTDLPQLPLPRCIHLQSKSLAVYGEGFADDPDVAGGVADFWCGETGRGLGPDDDPVSLHCCCEPDRGCHREY